MSLFTGTWTRMRLRLPGKGGMLPDRTAILLTNPRSGSTWLLDLLRAHPRIDMEERATIFRALRMEGRRYPLDLSGAEEGQRIEVRPGRWDRIPLFETREIAPGVEGRLRAAVEKCHPHFFDHRIDRFLQDVDLLGRATQVRMVYQVRDPRISIVSFLRYQERNPSWNAERGPSEVVAHMRRIFETILAIAERLPGAVVDYGDLKRVTVPVIRDLLGAIWERDPDDLLEGYDLLEAMTAATRREERKAGKGTFLGARESRVGEEAEALFQRHASDLAAADEAFRRLLELPGRIAPEEDAR